MNTVRVGVGGGGGARLGEAGIDSVVGWGGVLVVGLPSTSSEGVMVIRGLGIKSVGEVVIGSNCSSEVAAGLLPCRLSFDNSSPAIALGGALSSSRWTSLLLEASCWFRTESPSSCASTSSFTASVRALLASS